MIAVMREWRPHAHDYEGNAQNTPGMDAEHESHTNKPQTHNTQCFFLSVHVFTILHTNTRTHTPTKIQVRCKKTLNMQD